MDPTGERIDPDVTFGDRPTPCPGCGYELRAVPSLVCPECGRHCSLAELRASPRIAERNRRPRWLLLSIPAIVCFIVLLPIPRVVRSLLLFVALSMLAMGLLSHLTTAPVKHSIRSLHKELVRLGFRVGRGESPTLLPLDIPQDHTQRIRTLLGPFDETVSSGFSTRLSALGSLRDTEVFFALISACISW